MPLSKDQLREVQEIVEQWRRPRLRDADWRAEISVSRADFLTRPPASDLRLDRLDRALLHNYHRKTQSLEAEREEPEN
jgi:hypothetical protein